MTASQGSHILLNVRRPGLGHPDNLSFATVPSMQFRAHVPVNETVGVLSAPEGAYRAAASPNGMRFAAMASSSSLPTDPTSPRG